MTENKAIRVQTLFTKITEATENEDYDIVVELCNKVLKEIPNDFDAFHTKIIALINDSRFSDAIKIAKQKPHASKVKFELAYAQYRELRTKEALDTLNSIKQNNNGVRHLRAQILYRLDRFDDAVSIYENDIDFKEHEQDEEEVLHVKANVCAAYVGANKSQRAVQRFEPKHTENIDSLSFEFAFNIACAFINLKDYEKSRQFLKFAEVICRKSDELTQEEIKEEMVPISVQNAFLFQTQGFIEKSTKIYDDILRSRLTDQSVLSVVENNSLCIRHTLDPAGKIFDSLKRSNRIMQSKKQTIQQQKAFHLNRCLLFMFGKQHSKCVDQINLFRKLCPESELPLLVHSSLLFREKKYLRCIEMLKARAAEYDEKSTDPPYAVLSLAHIALLKNDIKEAVTILSSLKGPLTHYPAIIATVVALHEKLGDIDSACLILDKSVDFWRNSMNDDDSDRSSKFTDIFVHQAAMFKLKHKRYSEALVLFNEAISRNPNNLSILCNLVIAGSYSDPQHADEMAARLPELPGINMINIEELVKQSGPSGSSGIYLRSRLKERKHDEQKTTEEAEAIAKRRREKRKKKRKRFPKGFDPENPGPMPDPERWLPRWKRSNFRRKRKKDKNFRGAQGGESNIDYQVQALKPENFETQTESIPKQTSSKQIKKKKKNRRR